MTVNRIMDYYNQLQSYTLTNVDQMSLSSVIRRLHMIKRKEHKYKRHLQEDFHYGLATSNYDEHIKMGFWFAEIYNIDPTFMDIFSSLKDEFYRVSLRNVLYNQENLEKSIILAARLMDLDNFHSLLNDLKNFALQPQEKSKKIIKILKVMNQTINWQIERKEIYLKTRNYETIKMIKLVLRQLKEMPGLDYSRIVSQKLNLLSTVIKCLLSNNKQNKQPSNQVSSFQKQITQEIMHYQTIELSNNQEDSLMELMVEAINLFGIYNQEKLETFVYNNKYKSQNISYLELFQTFADHLQAITNPKTQKDMQYLAYNLIQKVFQISTNSFSAIFNILKKKSDIIIRLHQLSVFNLTKHLEKSLEKTQVNYYQMFLTSLITIYNPTLRTEVTTRISPAEQSSFYQSKHYGVYYQMVQYFASESFNFTDFLLDPESKQGLLWGLLALRNTIKVNYHFIHEKGYVLRIYNNLMKLMLANVLTNQCTQLALQMLQKKQGTRLIFHNVASPNYVDYAYLIFAVSQVAVISLEALENLKKILVAHFKLYEKQSLQHLELFKQLCILGTKLLQAVSDSEQDLKWSYIYTFFNLLRMSLPNRNEEQIPAAAVVEAKNCLVNLMFYDQKCAIFCVYLDLAYTFRESEALNELVTDTRINIPQDNFLWKKFKVLHYMGTTTDIRLKELEELWPQTIQAINSKDRDLGLYFIELNKLCLEKYIRRVETKPGELGKYRLYLRIQTTQLISALTMVYEQIEESNLVANLENLLEMSIMLHINLSSMLTELEKYGDVTNSLKNNFLDLSKRTSKWLKIMEDMGRADFVQQERGRILQLWQSSYSTLVWIASLTYQTVQVLGTDINFSFATMKRKFMNATDKLRQTMRQEVEHFELLFSQAQYSELLQDQI